MQAPDKAQQTTSGQQSKPTAGEQERAVAGSEDSASPAPSGTSRSSTQAAPGDPTGGKAAGYRTEGETIYVLDGQLSSSLSEFDEKMRKEMETLSNARRSSGVGDESYDAAGGIGDAAAGDAAAGDGGDGQGESASGSTPGERQQGSQQASGSESGTSSQSGDSTGEAANTTSQGRRGGAPRPSIPDGSDDDIVARQLREAAETETDPVLKEKLWEEYTNYKKGSS